MPSEGDRGADAPEKKGVDTVVEMGNSTHVGSFQTKILEGKISQAPACETHIMVTPIGRAEVKQDGGHQLPPVLQVLHTYTTMTAGHKQISIVVQNMTDQAISLKKGTRVVYVVSATLAPLDGNTFNSRRGHPCTERKHDDAGAARQAVGEIEP